MDILNILIVFLIVFSFSLVFIQIYEHIQNTDYNKLCEKKGFEICYIESKNEEGTI